MCVQVKREDRARSTRASRAHIVPLARIASVGIELSLHRVEAAVVSWLLLALADCGLYGKVRLLHAVIGFYGRHCVSWERKQSIFRVTSFLWLVCAAVEILGSLAVLACQRPRT